MQTAACSELSWEGFYGKLPQRIKVLVRTGSFSKNAFLEAQKQFIALKGKRNRQSKRPPDLTASLQVCSKPRDAYQRWKSRQIAIEYYKDTTRACREAVKKAEVQPTLKLSRDVKNPKKGYFVYVNSKKQKENMDLMLNRRDELVTNNAEKARGSQHFLLLCLLHPALLGPRPWEQKSRLMQTQT